MSELLSRYRSPESSSPTQEIFEAHVGGKLSVGLTAPLDTQRSLSIAYTPGVAQVSRAIAADHTLAARYTWANRLVAVVSDGSAVLGLGDIGPAASLPVMEGKCALFKAFGGLDAIPIVLDTKDPDEIVETLVRLRPTFGAVNLEDISAPRCFEIERRVDRGAGLPGDARRPARHGDRRAGGADGCHQGARPRHGVAAGGGLRRRGGGRRVHESPSRHGGFGHHGARLARHPAHRSRRHEQRQGRSGATHQSRRSHRRHGGSARRAPTYSSGCRGAWFPKS